MPQPTLAPHIDQLGVALVARGARVAEDPMTAQGAIHRAFIAEQRPYLQGDHQLLRNYPQASSSLRFVNTTSGRRRSLFVKNAMG